MKIVNRTPHPITITPTGTASEAPVITLPAAPRGEVARVETTSRTVRRIWQGDGDPMIPITETSWGRVIGLPAPVTGTVHIVSVIVVEAARAAGRDTSDLYTPGDQVRDASSRIVGCSSLTTAASAAPSSIAADWVRAMRSMGAEALRGPVNPKGIHIGIAPDPGYPHTIYALRGEGQGGPRICGSILVDSDEYPLGPHVSSWSDVADAWRASGGTVDKPGLADIRLGEEVVANVPSEKQIVRGVLTADGLRVETFRPFTRIVSGSRLVPLSETLALRPAHEVGIAGLDYVAAPTR